MACRALGWELSAGTVRGSTGEDRGMRSTTHEALVSASPAGGECGPAVNDCESILATSIDAFTC